VVRVTDCRAGRVRGQLVDDRPAEFRRIAHERIGLKYRFGYMISTDISEFVGAELVKYDLSVIPFDSHKFFATQTRTRFRWRTGMEIAVASAAHTF